MASLRIGNKCGRAAETSGTSSPRHYELGVIQNSGCRTWLGGAGKAFAGCRGNPTQSRTWLTGVFTGRSRRLAFIGLGGSHRSRGTRPSCWQSPQYIIVVSGLRLRVRGGPRITCGPPLCLSRKWFGTGDPVVARVWTLSYFPRALPSRRLRGACPVIGEIHRPWLADPQHQLVGRRPLRALRISSHSDSRVSQSAMSSRRSVIVYPLSCSGPSDFL